MPLMKINNVNLMVEEFGSGKPVVVVHGLTSSMESMFPVKDALPDKYRIIMYDCRGHGRSEKVKNYTLNDHANDLLALLDALSLEKVDIVSLSMGTYIAQAAAIKAPERFNHLVLMGAKAHGKTSSIARIMQEEGVSEASLTPAEFGKIIAKYTFAPMTGVEAKMRMMSSAGSVVMTAEDKAEANKALVDFDLREGLKTMAVPALVIAGKYDGINPPELGKEIVALIPNGKYIEFEKSGHVMPIEEPDRMKEEILEFLEN